MPGERVMIVEDTPGVAKLVAAYLEAAEYSPIIAQNGQEALDLMEESPPALFIVDVMMPDMDGFELTARLRTDKRTAGIPIIILTAREAIEDKIRGFEAGADDYVIKPFEAPELLARVRALLARRAVVAPVVAQERQPGTVITIFGLRGGAGRSLLAANLSVALAAIGKQDVAACDLALESGHLALMLDARPVHTIDQLITRYGESFDPDVLTAHLSDTRHHVRLLAAPSTPASAPLVTPEGARAAIEQLRLDYPFVVVDLAPTFTEVSLTALELADVVLIVTTPEVAGVRAAAATLEILDTLRFPAQDLILVINQVANARPLSEVEISGALERQVGVMVPNDSRACTESINKGVPLVHSTPRSPTTRAIVGLGEKLAKRTASSIKKTAPARTTR